MKARVVRWTAAMWVASLSGLSRCGWHWPLNRRQKREARRRFVKRMERDLGVTFSKAEQKEAWRQGAQVSRMRSLRQEAERARLVALAAHHPTSGPIEVGAILYYNQPR